MKFEPFIVQQAISYHADFFVPDKAQKNLLVCLHGYGQSKEIAMKFGQKMSQGWMIAALQAPYPHFKRLDGNFDLGFSWISSFHSEEAIKNHHGFIKQVIGKAFEDKLILEKKAVLFGFSQSVSLNYRFAASHPDYVKGVIAVAGAAPSDWSVDVETPAVSAPVLHIAPQEDEAYSEKRLQDFKVKLERHCKQFTWHEEAGGHRVPRAAYPVIREWLEGL